MARSKAILRSRQQRYGFLYYSPVKSCDTVYIHIGAVLFDSTKKYFLMRFKIEVNFTASFTVALTNCMLEDCLYLH